MVCIDSRSDICPKWLSFEDQSQLQTLNQRIKPIIKKYTIHGTAYRNDKLFLNKKLKLKTVLLNGKSKNKLKYFRVMDFAIPMLTDLNSKQFPLSAYYNLSDFKRLVKTCFDHKDQMFHVFIEEKKISKIEQIKGISEINLFFNWLNSKGA